MPNQLAQATSPYLLQHADNPVDWREWGPEALAEASQRDVPILLSVGYAACHWCHVMAHESFENTAIAAQMNEQFVNIKVDREERPDLDGVFQNALAFLGEQGGWPLTMFLTPTGEPIWGGTYFPPTPRYNRPSLPQVLQHVSRLWRDERAKLLNNRDQLKNALIEIARPRPGEGLIAEMALDAAANLAAAFDKRHGGLGGAPKFPQAPILSFLWTASTMADNSAMRETVLHTLRRICQGGIYDHLGGGFARYSVDAMWLVPHFEKMLYDNGQLLGLLGEAWAATGEPLFRARAQETVDWIVREMRVDGAFASSLDADSEGEEGKFYLWSKAEIDALLGEQAAVFEAVYGVSEQGNFEGANILNRLHAEGLPAAEVASSLAHARAALFVSRETRVRPARDDKILADWNGLAIQGLVTAGLRCDEPAWIELARDIFATIVRTMDLDGRLIHSRRGPRATKIAFLDDYAAMARAAIDLYSATGEADYLRHAEAWLATVDRDYRDEEGNLYQTMEQGDGLLVRPRTAADGPVPSGAAMIAMVSSALFYLNGHHDHRERAESVFKSFGDDARRSPYGHASLMDAFLRSLAPVQVVIVGPPGDATTKTLGTVAARFAPPGSLLLRIAPDADLPSGHPAAGKGLVDGLASAYICAGPACMAPITDAEKLRVQLAKAGGAAID